MREILFRAKHSDPYNTVIWYYGYYERSDKSYHYIVEENGSIFPINYRTLGQFTELYDRNNVRVFEGDITRADNGHIGYVVFRNGSFVKLCLCHESSINRFYGYDETVIGNIYDNPELLKRRLTDD